MAEVTGAGRRAVRLRPRRRSRRLSGAGRAARGRRHARRRARSRRAIRCRSRIVCIATISSPAIRRRLRFTDVTVESGLAALERGYGMGVAVGDYDGDGWPDLYVTNLGPNQLLRNRGDGTVRGPDRGGRRRRAIAGACRRPSSTTTTTAGSTSSSATICDYDARHRAGLQRRGGRAPTTAGPTTSSRCPTASSSNRGDGTFEDVTARRRPALGLRTGAGRGGGRLRRRRATSTSTSPTTACPTTCGPTSAAGRFEDRALLDGAAVDAAGRAGRVDGRRRRRLRRRRRSRPLRHQAHQRGLDAVAQRVGAASFADVTVGTGLGGAEPPAHRLRRRVDRPRERRLARSRSSPTARSRRSRRWRAPAIPSRCTSAISSSATSEPAPAAAPSSR